MGGSLNLDVADWAAIVSAGDDLEDLGRTASTADIPMGQRRRLPPFARDVIRCALPLLRDAPQRTVVYAASHGDLDSTVRLLTDLANGELLSPTLFASSVHNAPAGALSLCLGPSGDHTALAGDETAFAAGLTEAYARLACGETDDLILILAEARLPAIYADFDDAAPSVVVTLALRAVTSTDGDEIGVEPGRAGAAAVARALSQGRRRLRFAPPHVRARAA